MRRLLGFFWASPLTLLGFVVVTVLCITGWCRRRGTYHEALVWETVPGRAPRWLLGRWSAWSAGNVILARGNLGGHRRPIMRHELQHVRQAMRLGPLYPLAYAGCYLVAAAIGAHPVLDHPMEVAARRAAGQVVDVVGAVTAALARRHRA